MLQKDNHNFTTTNIFMQGAKSSNAEFGLKKLRHCSIFEALAVVFV
jgi:hypothetical protein